MVGRGVLVELDLCVSERSFGSLLDLEYRLDEPGPPTQREPTTPDYVDSELTVEHTVHVPATVQLTGDERQPYSELRLGDDTWLKSFLETTE